jgi:hypothetical protein
VCSRQLTRNGDLAGLVPWEVGLPVSPPLLPFSHVVSSTAILQWLISASGVFFLFLTRPVVSPPSILTSSHLPSANRDCRSNTNELYLSFGFCGMVMIRLAHKSRGLGNFKSTIDHPVFTATPAPQPARDIENPIRAEIAKGSFGHLLFAAKNSHLPATGSSGTKQKMQSCSIRVEAVVNISVYLGQTPTRQWQVE